MNVSPQRLTVVFTALLCIAGLGSPAAAQSRRKLDRALRAPNVRTSVQRVIIQTRPGASVAVRRLLEQRGNVVESEHPTLDAMTVALKGADLAALEADPAVLAVSIDAEVTSFGSFRPG